MNKINKKNKMTNKRIYFIGILANVDASILKLKLDNDFKIESRPTNEFINFISILENISLMETHKIFMPLQCINHDEKRIYFISNFIESDTSNDSENFNKTAKFENQLIHGYLLPALKLLRLYKKGNICMPLKYYYLIKDGNPVSFIRGGTTLYIAEELFSINKYEIKNILNFIRNTQFPFEQPFLKLAFDSFEESYIIRSNSLSFLSLMISIESLLNPADHELKYRISRNTAVLLGKNLEESNKIFSEMQKLYNKRSQIVHTGKSDIISNDDLLLLRQYVRESIKKIYEIGKDKNELLKLLNMKGFGNNIRVNE